MSDIGQEDKPWNMITDAGRHRCDPKRKRRGKPREGDRSSCACGIEYVYSNSPFGMQWLPTSADDFIPAGSTARRRAGHAQ